MSKLLVIDDKPDNLIVVKAICHKLLPELTVITALSGQQGLELARKELPDTILLDIIMPKMDGYEVCRLLKADAELSIIPVIMLTAILTNTSARVKGLEIGADAFLNKPINEEDLLAQIKVMLRIKAAEDALRREKASLEETVAERTASLRRSEKKFRALYDKAPLSYQALDENGCFNDVNPAWLSTLGYEREAVIGHYFTDFLHSDWKSYFDELFPVLKNCGFAHDVQFKIRHQDGHYLDVSFESSVSYTADGSFEQAYCVFKDITKRLQAEVALRENESNLKAIIENSLESIWSINTDYEIQYTNEIFANFIYAAFGVKPSRGINLLQVLPDDLKPRWKERCGRAFNNEQFVFEEKIDLGHIQICTEVAVTPILVDDKVIGASFYGRDVTEQKRSMEALKNSEARLKILFESAPDAIYLGDLKGNLIDVNKAAEKLLGYTKAELIEKSVSKLKLISEQSLLKRIKLLAKNVRGKGTGPDEFVLNRKDGSQVTVEILTFPVTIGDETLVLGIARDITQRKLAEKALIESETRFKALHNASFGGIAIHDKGFILECNQGLSDITGYSMAELINMDGMLLISEKTRSDVMDKILSGYEQAYESIGLRKNGEEYPLHLEARNIPYKGKNVRVVEFRDITQRKQAELKHRESEEFNKSIMLTAPDAIISINDAGLVLTWNKVAETLFGYSETEMQGQPLDRIIPSPHTITHHAGLKHLREGGQAKLLGNIIEITGLSRQGEEFPIELGLSGWTTGEHKFYTAIIRDISERKRIEAELKAALLTAEQASQVKDQFVANISHEIRTPLNSILGFSDLFKIKYSDLVQDKDKVIFDYIGESSARLMHTVDSILNISMLQSGTITIHKEIIKLKQLISITVNNFKLSAEKKKLSIQFNSLDSEVEIFADKSCVSSALVNLIDNAIKYTHEGGIRITLEIIKGQATLAISDDGIGISDEYRQRIFEPYTQESEGFTKDFQGVGLGLAITKRYLDLNDIKLELVSQKNVGSTFTLIFPKYERENNGSE